MAKRGRPPGSKNKPKVKVAEVETNVANVKRGRPVTNVEVMAKRGRPARLTKDLRCSCGRNLRYPLEEDEHLITCRCGKKYAK